MGNSRKNLKGGESCHLRAHAARHKEKQAVSPVMTQAPRQPATLLAACNPPRSRTWRRAHRRSARRRHRSAPGFLCFVFCHGNPFENPSLNPWQPEKLVEISPKKLLEILGHSSASFWLESSIYLVRTYLRLLQKSGNMTLLQCPKLASGHPGCLHRLWLRAEN